MERWEYLILALFVVAVAILIYLIGWGKKDGMDHLGPW